MIDLIKVSSEAQIADVAQLAREIWCEHYVPIIGQEQVDYMLGKFQSERAIAEQITEAYEYYIIAHHGKSVGYMAALSNMEEASLMLSKIYVKKSARGRGFGQKMLGFIDNLCRHRAIKKIWLTVNKNNLHAISWYSRMGFINTASLIQEIGEEFVMDDFRMEKTIGQQTSTGNLIVSENPSVLKQTFTLTRATTP